MRIHSVKFAFLFAVFSTATFAQTPLQVKTDTGIVEGKMEGAARAFLGIPYAAPPVGDLRWKPPMPPASWSGTRKATEFGPRCMQTRVFDDMVFRDSGPSEDCLTLNVWTPAKASKEKLPVMVWIHGGGLVAGGSSEPRQDGATLTEQGVILVSMNYRMTIFGFFALPELTAESGKHAAGNYGLLDQLASLQWVKKNIAAFGGDPGSITIFGESAGSFSVSDLMASPLAKGLFHKAIGESGAHFEHKGRLTITLSEAAKKDAEFIKTATGTNSLKELRAMPAGKLLEAVSKPGSRREAMGVIVDGYFLPKSLEETFAAAKQNDVPLLAGWNHDEGGFEASLTAASVKEHATKEFGDKSGEFLKFYSATDDATARRSWEDFSGDRFIGFGTWKWLEAQAKTGKEPVYRFSFDLAPPRDSDGHEGNGAYHSAEIEYVFGTLEWRIPTEWRAEDRAVSLLMRKYWANFARTGNPNAAGLPHWPKYEPKGEAVLMHLNAESKAEKDSNRARYLFLQTNWK